MFVCVFVCLYSVCQYLGVFLFVYIQFVNVWVCFCLSLFSLSMFFCVLVCLYSVCQCLSVFLLVCFWFEVNAFININAQYGELSFSRKFNLFIKILLTNVKKYTINSNKWWVALYCFILILKAHGLVYSDKIADGKNLMTTWIPLWYGFIV